MIANLLNESACNVWFWYYKKNFKTSTWIPEMALSCAKHCQFDEGAFRFSKFSHHKVCNCVCNCNIHICNRLWLLLQTIHLKKASSTKIVCELSLTAWKLRQIESGNEKQKRERTSALLLIEENQAVTHEVPNPSKKQWKSYQWQKLLVKK